MSTAYLQKNRCFFIAKAEKSTIFLLCGGTGQSFSSLLRRFSGAKRRVRHKLIAGKGNNATLCQFAWRITGYESKLLVQPA